MATGTPVNRQWVLVLQDGRIVIDWGDTMFQDVRSGEFIQVKEHEISHRATDEILEWLKRINRVASYDSQVVYFFNLPERPQDTIQ